MVTATGKRWVQEVASTLLSLIRNRLKLGGRLNLPEGLEAAV